MKKAIKSTVMWTWKKTTYQNPLKRQPQGRAAVSAFVKKKAVSVTNTTLLLKMPAEEERTKPKVSWFASYINVHVSVRGIISEIEDRNIIEKISKPWKWFIEKIRKTDTFGSIDQEKGKTQITKIRIKRVNIITKHL